MKTLVCKIYSTSNVSRYSTVGRRNARVQANSICTEVMPPKYGERKASYEAKQELTRMFN